MPRYAANTSVSTERSQEQIKSTLRRYGADGFGVIEESGRAAVMFRISGLTARIDVPLPNRQDVAFTTSDAGRRRTDVAAAAAYDAACRQRWRALLLAIKAKLEAVECKISTLETEFMPFLVLPDGRTLAQRLLPVLHEAVSEGRMPKLFLPGPGSE